MTYELPNPQLIIISKINYGLDNPQLIRKFGIADYTILNDEQQKKYSHRGER